MIEETYKIILFDGICNICSATVNFVIDHDKNNLYKFASLQSPIGKEYLKKFNLPLVGITSCVLIEGDDFYTSSTAVLRVAKDMNGPTKLLYIGIIIPSSFRDLLYKAISKRRYDILGKNDTCHMPTEDRKHKFL